MGAWPDGSMKERTRAMTAPAGRVVRSAAQGIRTFWVSLPERVTKILKRASASAQTRRKNFRKIKINHPRTV
jgi:hypothetical protein